MAQRTSEHDGSTPRGFAAMDADKQRQISSKGGQAAHKKGTAHEFSSAQAREAGRKGGLAGSAQQHAKAGSQSHKSG